ncbi:MAG: hypothetical protein DRP74_07840 [Candidatus Omnitrophota bacterium]|nr:MAG: hypothetical protein DRP74_07840 [Candidatus Omnitrophota bacterium]
MSSPPVTQHAVLRLLKKHNIKAQRYLDLGCGDGSFTLKVTNLVKAKEVIGVDISDQALSRARGKGIKTFKVDLETDSLPFINDYFDLITAIEVVEHLRTVDNLLTEAFRVLKPRGFLVIATPNLGSWINRLLLLFGYQPMHTEPSKKYHVGLPIRNVKEKSSYAGHVNLMTTKALRSLLKAYGFIIVEEQGIHWHIRYKILDIADKLFSKIPSLAHGIAVLARKPLNDERGFARKVAYS